MEAEQTEETTTVETTDTQTNAGAIETAPAKTTSKITLAGLEKEAEEFMLGGGQFTSGYLSRGIGKYILFKKDSDSPMKHAYKCPECGKEGGDETNMEKPYTITCAGCEAIVFKQEKVKGKRKGKKKKKK
jgi:DNA-directed RNA polymerase subunit RPC12/RpoP|tara:strand:- start:42679 stop:43068 length:390 start_codon:yes stop_codon:yes gene_type:complete